MKLLSISIFIMTSCFLVNNSADYKECASLDKGLELLQKEVFQKLDKRLKTLKKDSEVSNLNQIRGHLNQLGVDAYRKGFALLEKNGLNCSNVNSWRLIDMYLNHEPFHFIYSIAELKDGSFMVASYDSSLNQEVYLGKMEEDYLTKMSNFISPNSKGYISKNYILSTVFSDENILELDISTDVNLNTINQISLLGKVLFKK